MEERLQRLLVLAGFDAADAQLVVAPPEAAIDLLPPRGRQHVLVEGAEERLGALQRGERVALPRLLHAADRLGGELADLAAERAGEELAKARVAARGEPRIGQRVAQEPAGRPVLLPLHERHDRALPRRPQPRLGGDGEVG